MQQRGFTLIELIVAIAVLAVMGTAAYAGWFNVIKISNTTEASIDRYDAMERTFYWLQEDFEQVVNRDMVDELGGRRKSLEVSQAGEFVIQITRGGWSNPALLQMPPRSDLQRVAYIVDDQARLLRRYWYHLDRFDTTAFQERQILENVNALTFRFYDRVSGEWHTVWPPEDNIDEDFNLLPAAVEVTVDMEGVGLVERLFALPY